MFKQSILALIGLCLIMPAAWAEAQLKLQPAENVFQGGQLALDFRPEQSDAQLHGPLRVQFAGQTIELFEHTSAYRCLIAIPADQKAGGYTLRVTDAQNKELAAQKIEVKGLARSSQNIRFYSPQLSPAQKKQLEQEDALVDAARASRTPEPLWQGPFSPPVPHAVSAVYGIRRYLNGKYNGYHGGVDFLSPMSYAIKAPAAGKVTLARYFAKFNSNGNTLFLDHGLGVTSVYLHISKFLVKEGELVKKGQPVALVGSTGRSTGPHLHWGMYLNGKNTDGLAWIKFTQGLQF